MISKCCPRGFQVVPSVVHVVTQWCQVIDIYVAKKCVERVPVILLQWLKFLHTYNVVIKDWFDPKKSAVLVGGSVVGRDGGYLY